MPTARSSRRAGSIWSIRTARPSWPARSPTRAAGPRGGLSTYGSALHLRPGVEVVSATSQGNLTVSGDIDPAGYRYGPGADRDTTSAAYGAGEPLAR